MNKRVLALSPGRWGSIPPIWSIILDGFETSPDDNGATSDGISFQGLGSGSEWDLESGEKKNRVFTVDWSLGKSAIGPCLNPGLLSSFIKHDWLGQPNFYWQNHLWCLNAFSSQVCCWLNSSTSQTHQHRNFLSQSKPASYLWNLLTQFLYKLHQFCRPNQNESHVFPGVSRASGRSIPDLRRGCYEEWGTGHTNWAGRLKPSLDLALFWNTNHHLFRIHFFLGTGLSLSLCVYISQKKIGYNDKTLAKSRISDVNRTEPRCWSTTICWDYRMTIVINDESGYMFTLTTPQSKAQTYPHIPTVRKWGSRNCRSDGPSISFWCNLTKLRKKWSCYNCMDPLIIKRGYLGNAYKWL